MKIRRKDVKLEAYQSATIRDLTYSLEETEMWTVHLTVHFEASVEKDSTAVEGNLTIELKELLVLPVNATISAMPDENGEFSYNVSFQVAKVSVSVKSTENTNLTFTALPIGKSETLVAEWVRGSTLVYVNGNLGRCCRTHRHKRHQQHRSEIHGVIKKCTNWFPYN